MEDQKIIRQYDFKKENIQLIDYLLDDVETGDNISIYNQGILIDTCVADAKELFISNLDKERVLSYIDDVITNKRTIIDEEDNGKTCTKEVTHHKIYIGETITNRSKFRGVITTDDCVYYTQWYIVGEEDELTTNKKMVEEATKIVNSKDLTVWKYKTEYERINVNELLDFSSFMLKAKVGESVNLKFKDGKDYELVKLDDDILGFKDCLFESSFTIIDSFNDTKRLENWFAENAPDALLATCTIHMPTPQNLFGNIYADVYYNRGPENNLFEYFRYNLMAKLGGFEMKENVNTVFGNKYWLFTYVGVEHSLAVIDGNLTKAHPNLQLGVPAYLKFTWLDVK